VEVSGTAFQAAGKVTMSDATQLAAVVGVITSAATALLTLACTKGIDAIIKYRKDSREDRQHEREGVLAEESVAIKVYEQVVEQLTQRVATLEQQIVVMQTASVAQAASMQAARDAQDAAAHAIHLECVKEQERLRGEVNVLREQVERLKTHDARNQEQVKENLKGIKELEAKLGKDKP
jgi:chromosome segregation ATPase